MLPDQSYSRVIKIELHIADASVLLAALVSGNHPPPGIPARDSYAWRMQRCIDAIRNAMTRWPDAS